MTVKAPSSKNENSFKMIRGLSALVSGLVSGKSLAWLFFGAIFYWAAQAVEFDLGRLWMNRAQLSDFVSGMFPPDVSEFPMIFGEVVVTIELAFVGTVIATIIALPLGFLASRRLMPQTFLGRCIVNTTRFFLNADRAIDAVIFALFFAGAVGLGPFAGTLALAIHSVGMLGKLFYESIESVDQGPLEAIESVGAGRLAVMRWAVLPQVIPYFVTYFLFRFELNIRSAVVLGVVGAGGIGFLLQTYMKLFQYQKTCTVILVILVLVMGIDALSSKARQKLLSA